MSNTWLEALIAKHRRSGILLDSNLLLVYGVGILNPSLLGMEKGTREYELPDFQLLHRFISAFDRVLTTPNVLTEVSNLALRMRESIRVSFLEMMRDDIFPIFDEQYLESKGTARHEFFTTLGLTDATIASIARQGTLVLTNDLSLRVMLEGSRLDCVHYDRDLRPLVLNME